MIRLIALLVGLGFAGVALFSFGVGAWTVATEGLGEETAEHAIYKYPKAPEGGFQHAGVFGSWDKAQLQRGYKVYKEVCAACHSLRHVAFRNLEDLGYDEGQVKAEAAAWQVPGIDPNTGEATTRPGLATDYFPSPYPNDVAAAAANNNAIPPDLSLITKARKDGTNYVYSLLQGYQEPSQEMKTRFPDSLPGEGLHHNPYFKNLNLAMAPPLADGQVDYDDGAPNDVKAMSADVAAFLAWTAEPSLVERKRTGLWFLGFMIFATILAYLSKQQVWSSVKPRKD